MFDWNEVCLFGQSALSSRRLCGLWTTCWWPSNISSKSSCLSFKVFSISLDPSWGYLHSPSSVCKACYNVAATCFSPNCYRFSVKIFPFSWKQLFFSFRNEDVSPRVFGPLPWELDWYLLILGCRHLLEIYFNQWWSPTVTFFLGKTVTPIP